MNLPNPPSPKSQADATRWAETRLRRRLLYGEWEQDLKTAIEKRVGRNRARAWGCPDLSANTFKAACSQLAVLYDRGVKVTHQDVAAAEELTRQLDIIGYWPAMQRVQRDTIGLREMLCRVDVVTLDDGSRQLVHRHVPPDLVTAEADPENPDQPLLIEELTVRDGSWCWEKLDIRNAANPSYTLRIGQNEEVYAGAAYPYRWADGRPYLPYVVYHAAKTGKIFDYTELQEVVNGTINSAVNYTFWAHCLDTASHPQRYVAGLTLAGTESQGEGDSPVIESDPAFVLQFQPSHMATGQMQIGQWGPGADVDKLLDAIATYERRVAGFAGISPADIQRVSGDPRSGYALAITRESQREAQRRFAPQFSVADVEMLSKSASLLALPETGWRIEYGAIPLSPDEMEAQRRDVLEQVNAGLLTKVDGWLRLNPGKTREEAVAYFETEADNGREYPAEYVSIATNLLIQVQAGQVTIENARAVLTTMMGLTPEQAAEFK